MKYWYFVLLLLAIGCKKEDSATNSSSVEKPPILISSGFSNGSSSISNTHNDGSALGYSYSLDLSTFDSIKVTWTATHSPFPATGGNTYRVFLSHDITGTQQTVYYDKPPLSSPQTFLIIIPSYRIINRSNVSFKLMVGGAPSPSSGTFTAYDFSIYGWKP